MPANPNNWAERLSEEARIQDEARMLRDDQPLTDELRTEVIRQFRDYCARSATSDEKAARSIGISPAVLSQVLSGTYAADSEKHIRLIDKWTANRQMREKAPRDPGYVDLKICEKIFGAVKFVYKVGGIGLIHGPSSIGKTRTLNACRAFFPGSIYISAATAGISKLSVLEALTLATRGPMTAYTANNLYNALVAKDGPLAERYRLIMVDEAHKFAGRRSDEALHVIRDIHDATGCPIILAGMSNLAQYIAEGKNRWDPLEQIDARIVFRLDLTALANSVLDGGPGLFTIGDIEKYLAAREVRVTGDGVEYLQKMANQPKAGHLRLVDAVIKTTALDAYKGRVLTAPMIRDILMQHRGVRLIQAIEAQIEQRSVSAAG